MFVFLVTVERPNLTINGTISSSTTPSQPLMKSRSLSLVIFILVLASVTSALPSEGSDYREPDFLDDIYGLTTGAWEYIVPAIEPIVETLASTAVNNALPTSHHDQIQPFIPATLTGSQHQYAPSPSVSEHPAFDSIHQQQIWPQQMTYTDVQSTNPPPLTTTTLGHFNSQNPPLEDGVFQQWALSSAYAPVQRVALAMPTPTHWPNNAQYDPTVAAHGQQQPLPMQPRAILPLPEGRVLRRQGPSQARPRQLACGLNGCRYTSFSVQDLRHHQRYHTPMERRPHQCPYCDRRFLAPRELQRHFLTHGIQVGPRHFCHVPSCRYAIRGFGRRDHLTRHVRTRHAADSVQGDT